MNSWQNNDTYCAIYCYIFFHNYVVLDDKFKNASLFTTEDEKIEKELLIEYP